MTKNEVIAVLGYKPTPIGGLTALGSDNGRGGVSAAEFRAERGRFVLTKIGDLGASGVLRATGSPGKFNVVVQ